MKSNDGKDLGDIGLVVASVPTDSVDAFIKWLADTGHPAFTHAETAPPQIGALKTRMMMNLASVVERDKTIDYLKDLVIPPNNFLLFDTAVEIIIKSKKIWPLNKKTLAFFSELYKKNSAVFDDLIESIGQLCEKNTLYLQADHIDTVIASLVKQKELPEASLAILERFLDRANPAIESITHTISTEHRPELTVTANQQQLIHHDIPHALEMKTRIMHVLCEKLNLLNTDSKRDRFLRNIISLMVEFHDYVQGKPPSEFKSVELSTAAQIVEWLTTSLPIAKEPDIKKIIEFMADQVIVLGTTMVYSPKQTPDLSQLFLMVEEAAVKAGDTVSDESNQKLIKLMKTAMLVTGVCDKNPSALSAVATMQYTNPSTATIPGIKHYFQEGLMLERFFSSKLFTSPPSGDISAAQLNQQRFLITLVPHLSMSAEVIKKSKPGPVTSYIDFIVSCINKQLMCSSE